MTLPAWFPFVVVWDSAKAVRHDTEMMENRVRNNFIMSPVEND